MTDRTVAWIGPGMLLGVLLGVLLGYQAPNAMVALGFIGGLFINALSITVFPLLMASTVLGVYQLGSRQRLYRAGSRALLYFLLVGLTAAGFGIAAAELIRPGAGVVANMSDLHMSWAPQTIDTAQGWVFVGLVLFSILFGGTLTRFGPRAKSVTNLLGQVHQALMKVIAALLCVAPYGLLFLVGNYVAVAPLTPGSLFGATLIYPATILGAILVFALVVLPLAVRILGRRSPFRLFGSVSPAMLTAFGASSSQVALPFTYRGVVERQAVDSRAAALVLPTGAILNTGLTALCAVVATLFVAQVAEVSLSALQYVLILLLPLFLSVGVAGLPQPLLPILLSLFAIVGMPSHAFALIGMVLVVDWLVDRFRSAFNVWSDSAGAAIIAEASEFKTARVVPRDRDVSRAKGAPATARPAARSGPRRRELHESQRGRERRVPRRHPGRTPARADKPADRPAGTVAKSAVQAETASPFDMSSAQVPTRDIDLGGPSPSEPVSAEPPAEKSLPEASGAAGSRRGRTAGGPSGHRHSRPDRAPGEQADRRWERAEAGSTETSSESSGAVNGRLNPEIIARELARVSDRSGGDAGTRAGKTTQTETGVDSNISEVPGQAQGRGDSKAPESGTGAGSGEASKATLPADAGKGGPVPVQYGRSRSRRTEKTAAERAEAAKPRPDAPEPKDGFSNEDISFGRGKRKKTR